MTRPRYVNWGAVAAIATIGFGVWGVSEKSSEPRGDLVATVTHGIYEVRPGLISGTDELIAIGGDFKEVDDYRFSSVRERKAAEDAVADAVLEIRNRQELHLRYLIQDSGSLHGYYRITIENTGSHETREVRLVVPDDKVDARIIREGVENMSIVDHSGVFNFESLGIGEKIELLVWVSIPAANLGYAARDIRLSHSAGTGSVVTNNPVSPFWFRMSALDPFAVLFFIVFGGGLIYAAVLGLKMSKSWQQVEQTLSEAIGETRDAEQNPTDGRT